MPGSVARRSQVSRCRPLIAAAVAAVVLAPLVGAAQTPNSTQLPGTGPALTPGSDSGLTPDIGAIPPASNPDSNLLQPSLDGNPPTKPRFRRPNDAASGDQPPPTGVFTAPSRIGATPTYGAPQGFGAGGTGFDSLNLPKGKKKKLLAQAPPPAGPGVIAPETTFEPLPTTEFAVPPAAPAQPQAPLPVVYPNKAATRPGAVLPPLAESLPVNNPPPEVHPLSAAMRPGASVPVPPIDYADASTPPPGTQPMNTFPLGTPAQRPLPIAEGDAYAPVGIEGGSFLFFPSVDLSTAYDTNPQHIPGGAGSLYFVVAPELQVQSNWSRHSLTADISGYYMDYTNTSFVPSLNRPYFNSKIDGRIDVTRETQIVLENRVLVTTEYPGNPNLPAGLASLPIVTSVGGTVGVVQDFNRLNVSIKGTADRSTFENSQLTDGEVSSNADQNYDQYAAIARVTYEINPELKPFIELEEDTRIHDEQFDSNDEQRDSNGSSAKVGATLAMTGSLTGEMAVGYMERTYQDPTLPPISGPTLDGSLIWQATALTTAKFTASSIVNESILEGVSGSFSRDVSVEVDHALRRWLVANFMAGYGRDEYVGLGRDDSRYYVAGGLTYKLNQEIQLKGELRHDWLTSNFSGVAYDSTSILLGVHLQR
jgi:hypothetical protein